MDILGLIEELDITDAVVSIDAIGCQRETATQITTKDGHYLPALKENQKENAALWKSLSAVVKIEAVRYIKSTGKEEKETRYYITSSKASAEVMGKAVRSHWGIENRLHWQVNVSFSEDQFRKREGYATQNFSLINRIALNLIKQEQSKKRSVRRKRLDAGWDNNPKMSISTLIHQKVLIVIELMRVILLIINEL